MVRLIMTKGNLSSLCDSRKRKRVNAYDISTIVVKIMFNRNKES